MIYLVTTQKSLFEISHGISFAEIKDCLNYFKDHEEIAVDTETEGFDPYTKDILSLQLGDSENQYVIDLSSVSISCFKDLLESKLLLFQNAKFDLRFLYRYGIVPSEVYDTYLAEMVLTTGVINHKRSLDALCYRYLKIEMDKSIRGDIHKFGIYNIEVIKYAAKDVQYLHDIKRKQLEKIEANDLRMALKLDNWFVRALSYVEHCGIGFDVIKWSKKCKEDLQSLSISKKELDDWLIENRPEYIDSQLDIFDTQLKCTINWNSAKQVIPIFKSVGVDTTVLDKDSGEEKDSIDVKVLSKQKDIHPLIDIYIKYSKAQKLVSTFGEDYFKFINPITGRIHTSYKQILNTGRMSCGEKGKKGYPSYPNLQQVVKDDRHRSCFISEKGNKLVVTDYSGQEDVIFANYCKDPELLRFYLEGLGDGHSFVAKLCFPELKDVPLEEVKKKYPDLRQKAKAANFAIKFGGNGYTVANNLGLTQAEGDEIYDNYMNGFIGIKNYFADCKKKALERGYVLINNITGRKSYDHEHSEYLKLKEKTGDQGFWEKYRSEKVRNTALYINELKPLVRKRFQIENNLAKHSYNYPIQGSGADITKLACCYFFDWIVENKYFNIVKIVNIVHDETVIECPEDYASEVSDKIKECMEKSGSKFCKIIPLTAEPVITEWWTH